MDNINVFAHFHTILYIQFRFEALTKAFISLKVIYEPDLSGTLCELHNLNQYLLDLNLN